MRKSLILLIALGMAFVGCQKEPDPTPKPTPTPTPTVQPKWVSTEKSNKNAVLEEFTGQNCGYCPDGHKRANQILAAHPDNFFPIVIHGGYLSKPEMQCDDAKAIQSYFAPSGVPYGVVNRGNSNLDRGQWSVKVSQILGEPACVNVAANGTIDVATRTLKLNVEAYYTENGDNETNYLTVAMLQNNIEASQSNGSTNPDQMLPNGKYNHMHILRDIINEDTWGDVISPTTTGTLIEKEYTYTIPDKVGDFDVDLNNIEFIVFVAEKQHRYITNACKAEITKK